MASGIYCRIRRRLRPLLHINGRERRWRLAALLFSVKLPGKVISSNGEIDPVTGELFWGLYSEAAAVGDVEMTAACDTAH